MRAALLALVLVCIPAEGGPPSFIHLFAQVCVDDFPYKPGQKVTAMVYHTALAGFVMTVSGGALPAEEWICQINMADDRPKKKRKEEEMISQADARKLNMLVIELRNADDLANRFASGYTNYNGDEVKRKHATAVANYENFVKSITEE